LNDLADYALKLDSKDKGVSEARGNADNWNVAHRLLNHSLGLCTDCM
jgi:hypothetical protein